MIKYEKNLITHKFKMKSGGLLRNKAYFYVLNGQIYKYYDKIATFSWKEVVFAMTFGVWGAASFLNLFI